MAINSYSMRLYSFHKFLYVNKYNIISNQEFEIFQGFSKEPIIIENRQNSFEFCYFLKNFHEGLKLV